MQKSFYYLFAIVILASNTDFIKAFTFYSLGAANAQEAMGFMQTRGFVERFYMLAGNAFNYASVLCLWLIYRKKNGLRKIWGLWLALLASTLFYFIQTYGLWLPIAQGAQMNDNFALGFVKVTLYTNIVGIIAGLLGINIGKYLQAKVTV